MRATIAMAGPLAISARATKDPGHRADSEDNPAKNVAADYEDSAQVANRVAQHSDSDAEAAQHQPAICALRVRPTQQRFIPKHAH